MPKWVNHGYEHDKMAYACEQAEGGSFLLSGRRPEVGQSLCVQLGYTSDGSHPQTRNGLAKMVGEVTKVLPPPPAGLYLTKYSGQTVELSEEELSFLRKNMPTMSPSLLYHCNCGREHPIEATLASHGAVHGQAVLAKIQLSCDDESMLEPQLAGNWDAMLICTDNYTNGDIWELRAFHRAVDE
jgi:hypothetical protein